MAYISPRKIRLQNQKIASAINDLLQEVGRNDCFVIFYSYVGNLYKITAYKPGRLVKITELQLDFNPFEVNWNSTLKQLKKLTDVSEIVKEGNGYKFVP